MHFEAAVDDDALQVAVRVFALGEESSQNMTLKPITATEFAVVANGSVAGVVSFLELDEDGRPGYLWMSRAARRTSG